MPSGLLIRILIKGPDGQWNGIFCLRLIAKTSGSCPGSVRFRDMSLLFRLRLPAVPLRFLPVPPIHGYGIMTVRLHIYTHELSNSVGLLAHGPSTSTIIMLPRLFMAMVSWLLGYTYIFMNFQNPLGFSRTDLPHRRSPSGSA